MATAASFDAMNHSTFAEASTFTEATADRSVDKSAPEKPDTTLALATTSDSSATARVLLGMPSRVGHPRGRVVDGNGQQCREHHRTA